MYIDGRVHQRGLSTTDQVEDNDAVILDSGLHK